jgi:PAS domain S-box-containing protein
VGMDQKGMISFVNRQTESLFGYDRDELIGRPVETLVPEPLWQIYAQHKEDYFADPRTRSSGLDVVLSGRHQDGGEFPINVSLSHIDTGDVLLVITAVGDVAKQKLAVKNAQLTAAIVQYSDDAIIGATLKGIITSWNPAAERMYGYSSKEIIGKSGSLLRAEGRADETNDVLARVKAGQHLEHLETMRVRKDGTVFPVSITVAPIRDEDGAIVGASSIARDVTEQRRASAVTQRLARIVESSDDAIIGETLDGIITSWNPAATRMFGYSAAEIIGKSARLLVPEDQADEFESVLAKINAGQHVDHLETFNVRRDGTVFAISLTVSPIRDAGAVVGASMIVRDVTEQRQALASAHRMAAIIQDADDAIISGSLDGIIMSWNPAAERMYGYSSAEIIGKPAAYLTSKDRSSEIQAVLAKIKAGQHVDHLESKRVRKDGTVFPVSLTVSPIHDADGAVVGASVIHRDLTEQKGALELAQAMAAIVESSDDAIVARTLDGTITSWNPAAERMFGYSSAEIVGKPISLLTPEDRAGERISILAKISAGHPVENLETIRIRKDGTVFPVSLTVSPIRDAGGAVVGASVIYRDVSELKHAARYARSLIEAALDPLMTISPEGKIYDVNEATVKATGVPRSKLIGTDFSGYFTDPDQAHQGYQRAFAQGSVTDYPLTLRHRDGTLTDVLYNASVYRDTGGNVLGVCAAARDVTRQKEASEAAERMAAVVEYSDDAIIGCTLEGIITSWNPAAERLYGYSSEKITGRSVDLLSAKGRTGEISGVLTKIGRGRPVDNFETICARKDRTTFPVKLTVAPIHGPGGAVVGASAIARDVTEQRQALATAEQMAAIVESSDDAIIGRDLAGIITSWNPAAERMFGYSSAEIVGKSIDLLTPEDRAGEAEAVLARVKAGQPVEHLETLRVRKGGTPVPVSLTVSPIHDADGAVIGASVIARDRTEGT